MRESVCGCGCVRREPGNNWLSRHPHLPHPATGGCRVCNDTTQSGASTQDSRPECSDESWDTHRKRTRHPGLGLGQAALSNVCFLTWESPPHPRGRRPTPRKKGLSQRPREPGPHPEEANPPPQAPHTPRPLERPTPVPHHHQLRQRPRHSSPAPREPPEPSSPRLYLFKSDELLMHSLKVGIVKC